MPVEQIGFNISANTNDVLTLSEAVGALSAALIVAADANDLLDVVSNKTAKGILSAAGAFAEWSDVIRTGIVAVRNAYTEVLNLDAAFNTLYASGLNTRNLQLLQLWGESLFLNADAAEAFAIQAAGAAVRLEDTQAFVGTLFAGTENAPEMVDRLADSINNLVSGPLNDQLQQAAATEAAYDWLSAFPEYTQNVDGLTESMKGLEAGLKLAEATGTSQRQSLRGLAQTMQAFDIDADQAAETAAKLIEIQQQGITEVNQFAGRIGNLSGAAATADVSLEEMAGSLAVLTRTMGTDEAITSLENLMLSFVNLSPTARAEIEALGVDISKTAIANRGLVNVLNDVYDATERDSEAFARLIPEKRAFAAAMFLVEDSGAAAAEAIQNVADVGPEGLEQLFGARTVSSIASWNEIVNQAGRIVEEFGSRFVPVVTFGLEAFQGFLNAIESLPGPVRFLAEGLVTLLVSLQATTAAAGTLIDGILRISRIMFLARISMLAFNGTLAKMITGQMSLAQVLMTLAGTQATVVQTTNTSTAANTANTASTVVLRGGILGVAQAIGVQIKALALQVKGLAASTVAGAKWLVSGKAITALVGLWNRGLVTLATEGLGAAAAKTIAWTKEQIIAQKVTLKTILVNNSLTNSFGRLLAVFNKFVLPILAAVAAWKAFQAAINSVRDSTRGMRKDMEELIDVESSLEKQTGLVATAFQLLGKVAQRMVALVTKPIQTLQNSLETIFEPFLQAVDIIEEGLGFDIFPDQIVTNAEKNAAETQVYLADVARGMRGVQSEALSMAAAIREGEMDIDSPEAQRMLERLRETRTLLVAQRDALQDTDLPTDEIEKLTASFDAQISSIEAVEQRMLGLNVTQEEAAEITNKLQLELRELGQSLKFVEATGLGIDRWRELKNEFGLTTDLLSTGLDMFFALREAGFSASEGMEEVVRVLNLNEERTAGFMKFIEDSNAAREQRIADEIALTNAYDRQIDALEDRNDEADDFERILQNQNDELDTQNDLFQIQQAIREAGIDRQNTLLDNQIKDMEQVLEQEDLSTSARARAERKLAELTRQRKQEEIDRLVRQQEAAEQLFQAEQRQVAIQQELEQIELRREAIKLRIAALEAKTQIGVDEAALAEAERTGNIEEAAQLREQISERRELVKEIEAAMADVATAIEDSAAAAASQEAVDREKFRLDEEQRENRLFDTIMGFGTVDDEGTARERRRARQFQTEAEQGLTEAIYGGGDVGENVEEFLSGVLGTGDIPVAAPALTQQGALAAPSPAAAKKIATAQPATPRSIPQNVQAFGQETAQAIVAAIGAVADRIPSEDGIAAAVSQGSQRAGQIFQQNNSPGLAFGPSAYSAVGG